MAPEHWSRRRRTAFVLLVLLTLAYFGWLARGPLGAGFAWAGDRIGGAARTVEDWSTRLRRIADEVPSREAAVRVAAVGSRSLLLTVGSGPGEAAFALLSTPPEGIPTVTLIPQSLLGVVPGYGEFSLAEALAFEGPDLVALTVTNLLGLRVDRVLPLPSGALAAALPDPVEVDLPIPLVVDEEGAGPPVMAQGAQQVAPAAVEMLLVTRGAGDPFEWLQRQGAAWQAVLQVIAADHAVARRLASASPTGGAEEADLLLAVAAGDFHMGSLAVKRVAGVEGDALVLVGGAPAESIPAGLDHLLLRTGERPRVEILNGNGRIGTTRVVAEALVRRGLRVVRTDNADRFDYAETMVIAQGEDAEEAAREVAVVLGAASLFLEVRAPSTVVDVSIIVGQDIPAGEG